MDSTTETILACTAALAALIGWLYVHAHDQARRRHRQTSEKLEEIHGEVKSIHTRHDLADQRTEHAHVKLDKLRRGFSLLFRGETHAARLAFIDWWHSWREP